MRRLPEILRIVAAALALAAVLRFFHAPLRAVVWSPAAARLGVAEELGFDGSPGFVVHVRSLPSRAPVAIDGVPRGETPLFTNVECREGRRVELVVELGEDDVWSRSVECREDRLLLVRARRGE